MRFFISGEWTRNSLLKLIVVFFLLYVTVFWLTNALLYFHKMGLTYESVVDYYLGSEEKFLQPRSYQGLLEISHFHLFSMGDLQVLLEILQMFMQLVSLLALQVRMLGGCLEGLQLSVFLQLE